MQASPQRLTRTLAITGSTGRLGRKVARRLAAAGVPQRLLVRDPRRVPKLDDTEIVVAAYEDTEAVKRALDGVETVYLVSGDEVHDRADQHGSFVAAAVAAGVSRVVFLSFVGAAPDATFHWARDDWRTEQDIRSSGLRFTILRSNVYQDLLPFMAVDGVIRGVRCATTRRRCRRRTNPGSVSTPRTGWWKRGSACTPRRRRESWPRSPTPWNASPATRP